MLTWASSFSAPLASLSVPPPLYGCSPGLLASLALGLVFLPFHSAGGSSVRSPVAVAVDEEAASVPSARRG